MCQQKVQKQEFSDSVCYKIPYFTDSCDLRILNDSVTVPVASDLKILNDSVTVLVAKFL